MSEENRYLYHYHASYEMDGKVVNWDGVAKLVNRIVDQSDLHKLKQLIEFDKWEIMTMKSLSYLGREIDSTKDKDK
ncbi:MAG: hypothetical protein GY861_03940 [bacterium]|nr:hypothetical protein [bacterium]